MTKKLEPEITAFLKKYFENISSTIESETEGRLVRGRYSTLHKLTNGKISLWCETGWDPKEGFSLTKEDVVFSLALERDFSYYVKEDESLEITKEKFQKKFSDTNLWDDDLVDLKKIALRKLFIQLAPDDKTIYFSYSFKESKDDAISLIREFFRSLFENGLLTDEEQTILLSSELNKYLPFDITTTETKYFNKHNIWKISAGTYYFDEKKVDKLVEESFVSIADDTLPLASKKKTQWEDFRDAPVGDVCYLCNGSKSIRAIGIFISNVEEYDGKWKKRNVKWLFKSTSEKNYQGDSKWWTPNFNSTFTKVPQGDFQLFESVILQPFFGKSLVDLDKICLEKAKELELMMNEEKRMETLKTFLANNHNIILHGAPGTGKTYLAKKIAKALIFGDGNKKLYGEVKKQFDRRCRFVQFHQSYDYTDFVEGLRPVDDKENQKIGFKHKNGVFKEFCKDVIEVDCKNIDMDYAFELFKDAVRKTGKDGLRLQSTKSPVEFNVFLSETNALYVIPDGGNKCSITPKYIECYLKTGEYNNENHVTYEPAIGQYIKDNCIPHVFIIDEINRGEISKIFGELFFSIDPGYRGEKGRIKTQYQNLVGKEDVFAKGFFVPENVYIIGTMNDIDRSVESMDFAMRRRFAFKEIKADDRIEMLDSLKCGKKNEAVNCMRALNNEIEKISGLSSAYHIGPAYFLKLDNYEGNFEDLWKYHIEGVLREYLRGMPKATDLLTKLKGEYDKSIASGSSASTDDASGSTEKT